jgi:demethylmenaquinone methyltransferase/2-methoxy-6-polyprenyl-1,4-benzoquinol methylase
MTDQTPTPEATQTTHFGFTTVPVAEKASLVRGVFNSVAPRYDLMNDLMSLGIHRIWKSILLDTLKPRASMTLLDVGGGTGDVALGFKKRGGGSAMVVDINGEMVKVGRDRALDQGRIDDPAWVVGDAQCLPVTSRSVDAYTIAFCLRNVTNIDDALAEAYRVLKPGGRYLCLEFSHVVVPVLSQIYDAYSFHALPALGGLVAGDRASYQYLVESIRKFPPQAELAAKIEKAGFGQVTVRNLSGGIAAIHSGWRL